MMLGFTETPSDTNKQTATNEVQVLSDKDKAVKAEIAQHSDTNVDFRFKKQQIFDEKNYDLTFSKIGCITSDEITSNITYTNDNGDEVSYDLDTGRITMVYLRSNETKKTESSIDMLKAESIAYGIASKNCDIDKYVLESKEERDNGYMFSYCKRIYGYRTNDRVRVLVGFDGAIVSATIRFYAIDEETLNVDKEWYESEIKKAKEKDTKVEIEDAWIEKDRDSDKVYFNIKSKNYDSYGNVSAGVMCIEIK